MARMINSFALLDDEEGEDVTVLVENVAKKIDVTVVDPAVVDDKKQPPKKQPKNQQVNGKGASFPPSDAVRSEKGRGRGGRGRGSGRGGYGGNDSEHFGNEQENGFRRSYRDESKGNGYDDAYQGRGRVRGGGRGRGRGRNNDHVIPNEKEGSGDNRNNIEDAADGWEQVPQTHSRGYGNYVNNRDEERPFRNENRGYGGERRGYGGEGRGYGGERRGYVGEGRGYGGGSHGFRGRSDGVNHGRGEEATNDEVKENATVTDANDVNGAPNDSIAEGDVAAAVTEEPKDIGAEEEAQEEAVKVEDPIKKQEEEDEKLMTLEEYEKLYAEKRKALEAQKIEVRKVTADKDFEAMQLLEKKKEEILLVKPETAKLKKKDSLEKDEKSRKTVSINEFLKPADGEAFFYRRPGRGGRGRGGGRGGDGGGERGTRSGDFRNGERGLRGGDFKTEERVFRNNSGYSRGEGRGGPTIHIEDQSQFPVLKGAAAPAVEAA